MPNVAAILLEELEREAKTTRRVLERVPGGRLDWKPHARSMTLGQLAGHVAGIPGNITRHARGEGRDVVETAAMPAQPEAGTDFGATLDTEMAEARDFLSTLEDRDAFATWRLTAGGREILAIPRAAVIRTMLLNHWYHHRGQLVLYLRMLDVPVPVVYGRSADESPFTQP